MDQKDFDSLVKRTEWSFTDHKTKDWNPRDMAQACATMRHDPYVFDVPCNSC
jgi:hypothetical protein